MPTAVKTLDNMTKHLTKEELQARQQAEADFQPSRAPKAPKGFNAKTPERKIWDRVVSDMEGYKILDRLDTDVLEIYCRQLVRLHMLRGHLAEQTGGKSILELSKEIRGLEGTVLNYAGRLGLTPESRARLARAAAQPEEPEDPDGDLFG